MTQLALQIPVDGQPFATEGPKVGTSLTQIQTVVNGGLDTGNLASGAGIVGTQLASATVADDRLTSPNNVTYKQILPSVNAGTEGASALMASGSAYVLLEGAAAPSFSGGSLVTNISAAAGYGAFYIDPADYTAGSKANKYRLRASLLVGTTAPTSTFTVGLYPVSVSGSAGGITLTLGSVTAGSTVAFAAPAGLSANQGNSGDFTAPAAGFYAVCCAVTVANMAAGSNVNIRAILQHRQV